MSLWRANWQVGGRQHHVTFAAADWVQAVAWMEVWEEVYTPAGCKDLTLTALPPSRFNRKKRKIWGTIPE